MTSIIYSKAGEKFDAKAKLLGLTIDQKVDMLNQLYKDQLEFKKIFFELENGDVERIVINDVLDKDSIKIVLPYVEEMNYELMFDYLMLDKINAVELPKELNKIVLRKVTWLDRINKIFMYNSTELDTYGFEGLPFSMIIPMVNRRIPIFIKPVNGVGKAKVYNLT